MRFFHRGAGWGVLWVLLVPLLFGCGGNEPSPDRESLPSVGGQEGLRAPPLRGAAAAGETFTLPRDDSATVVVFFRGADCRLCRVRLQELQESLEAYRQAGVRVVTATPDTGAAVRELAAALAPSFPVVQVEGEVLRTWEIEEGVEGIPPASFLLSREGVVLFRHVGRHLGDRAADIELLAALRQGRRP